MGDDYDGPGCCVEGCKKPPYPKVLQLTHDVYFFMCQDHATQWYYSFEREYGLRRGKADMQSAFRVFRRGR